ncbi:hypothetical protein MASR1M36_23040 [Candidatus Cloacimonadaceae bacterium]
MAKGKAAWQIIPAKAQHVYWFSGSALAKAAKAQTLARPNELYCWLEPELREDSLLCHYQRINPHLCRILELKRQSSYRDTPLDQPDQKDFEPASISQLHSEGEFRDLLSCFVNLKQVAADQAEFVVKSALAQGAFISHIDCTDKGWVMYAIFGAPRCFDRYQKLACDFALEAKARCGKNIRIGMSEGRAFVGFVGSQTRSEYTGMGKAVNLAARIMMKTEWGEVCCEGILNKALQDSFVSESMGWTEYGGYPQPIETYRLVAKRQEGEVSTHDNLFVGRNAELEILLSSCQELFSGRFAGISYLYGAAGQGKTRLIYELKKKFGSEARFLVLQSDSLQRIALNPFIGWIRSEFTKDITGSLSERSAEFKNNWAVLANTFSDRSDKDIITAELNRIESIIAGLIGLEWEGCVFERLEPNSKAAVMGFAIKSLIEMLAKQKPVVLVMEDLHWLDKESESILKLLSRKTSGTALKIILTSRFRDDGSKPELKLDEVIKTDHLCLDGLSETGLGELLAYQLKLPASEELTAYIMNISQGNPFIAAQLSLYLQETGRLELRGKYYHLKEKAEQMPESVQAILVARIDRLERELKMMVQTASVLGCEFAAVILGAMLDDRQSTNFVIHKEAFESKLRQGELENIWKNVNEISYLFNHSLLRDAAYEMQLTKHLKRLHLLAAEAITRHYCEDRTWFAKIAFHYEKARAKMQAADYYLKAGDFEKEQYHFATALDYYGSATDLILGIKGNADPAYAKCLSRKGALHWGKSEYELALSYYEQALAILFTNLGDQHPDTAECLHSIGSYYYVKGSYEKALEYYQKALGIQRLGKNELQPAVASTLNCLGNVFKDQGNLNMAVELYEQALEIWKMLWGERHQKIATSYNCLADVYWIQGNYRQAMSLYEMALKIRLETLGDKHPETAIGYNCMGDVYSQTGHFDKALDCYQTALSIRLKTLGNRHTQTADSLNNLGIVYDITGEYAEALSQLQQALLIKEEIFGDLHLEVATILNNLGGVFDHQGEYDLALEQHEKALQIWMELLGEKHQETAACLNNIGCAYENKGDNGKALEYYEKALKIYLEVLGEKRFETSTALVNIGCIYENKQDYRTALLYYNRAFSIRQAVLGSDHPATQRTQNNISRLEEIVSTSL